MPITRDQVIYQYLSTSDHVLTREIKACFAGVTDNRSWKEKTVCRGLMRELGLLDTILEREWFLARLTPYQTRRVFLGKEGGRHCNDFSRYYSEETYRIDIAAKNMMAYSEQTGLRKKHHDTVMAKVPGINQRDLSGIILCASRWTINRKLRCFDGNHRLIAYYVRYGEIGPFQCIVGLSRSRLMNMLQRILLGFPFADKLKRALLFRVRQNTFRLLSLMRGGINYQPIFKDRSELKAVSELTNDRVFEKYRKVLSSSERPCLDRARLIHHDMLSQLGLLNNATMLDIGCNIGFFCHYYQALGMHATGIDNSRHVLKQKFTITNPIKVARNLNQVYGLTCTFHNADAQEFLSSNAEAFDVVLLLSVIHHFFIGYPVDERQRDPIVEARTFLKQVVRLTRKLLYIEYDETCAELSIDEFVAFLKSETEFSDVEIIGRSIDVNRPIIRCAHKTVAE